MMKKLVEDLTVHDYFDIEDILSELLREQFGIVSYASHNLEKGTEYITGTINIVKLGDTPSSLKHKQKNDKGWSWSEDIPMTESYEWATFYDLKKFKELCKNTLSGSNSETYNFRETLRRLRENSQ